MSLESIPENYMKIKYYYKKISNVFCNNVSDFVFRKIVCEIFCSLFQILFIYLITSRGDVNIGLILFTFLQMNI